MASGEPTESPAVCVAAHENHGLVQLASRKLHDAAAAGRELTVWDHEEMHGRVSERPSAAERGVGGKEQGRSRVEM
jgi:hypothetical protein